MEIALQWVLILTVFASFIVIDGRSHSRLVAAENHRRPDRMLANIDDSGFLSIDCGSREEYQDEETGFWYQTDKNFVETGESYTASAGAYSNIPYFGRQLNTLRCFPNGDRNCYTLRPEQGSKNNSRYLIRAFFSYGNYDGKNQFPSFELHLGVNLWEEVSLSDTYDYYYAEAIHTPSADTTQVCLVKTGPTIPCISALEVRPLNSTNIYPVNSSTHPQPAVLSSQIRGDAGSLNRTDFSRYKDDVYDRLWRHDRDVDGWDRLELDNSTDMDPATKYDDYKLPAQVLRTAAHSRNASNALNFDYNSLFRDLDKNFQYYVYFHFAEIEQLPAGRKRTIDITLNSENILPQPLVLEYLKPVTINHAAQGYVTFNISAASGSDAPPILSAFEIYKFIELDSPSNRRDVGAMLDIKSKYKISWLNWQGDPCLPEDFAWDGLNCSSHTNPRIKSLNLSSSKLTGEIHTSFSYLTALEVLDLSDNELEGPLPEFLAELPQLKVLNLAGNKLSGPIPKALKEKEDASTLQLSVDNNPDLCMADSCKSKTRFVVPLVASLLALVVILFISLGFWMFKRRQTVKAHINFEKGRSLESKHRTFTYTEILNITDNFKTVIGEGGFGKVYLGILQDHAQVAVKLISPSSTQGYREFRSEAELLSLVHHRNLVTLVGYCDEGEIKALIYEYMTNGNLQQHLLEKNPDVLKWKERLNVAVDAANGLDYLHNGVKPAIVRDLKTSNILLDQTKHAKIADFGLSRAFGNDIDTHISTHPAGTLGYIDPEFQRTGNLNKRSDVYSFGIILLELLTGRPALAKTQEEIISILEWVKPIVEKGDIQNIVDPRLKGEANTNSAWKVIEIAMSCTSSVAAQRPDISQICVELKECLSSETVRITREMSIQLDSDFYPSAR